jgi:hypothetical protein
VLRLTVWIAIGCFVSRIVFINVGLRPQHVWYIAAVLAFVISPFAAVGAIYDRTGTGIVCGIAFIAAIALLCLGAR